ncbi:MAG: translation elongation factor Ts [Alphaproteobacteria bacterium]|nr:translation elongation factor Ts [Alphaproteobacteria bacterium]
MPMSAQLIKALRERTGAGILDCKNALAESNDDLDAAVDWLRKKGISKAAKKADRVAAEGIIGHYIHAGGRIGVIVEVNSETDFVAQNASFQDLVRDIAMHIASENPKYLTKDEVPDSDRAAEREVQIARAMEEGKPREIAEKMVDGRMRKWLEEVVLLEQKFIKDDKKTINDLLTEAVARIGENIRIRRFARFEVGEGIEKKTSDLAAEVAATLAG